VRGLEGEKIRKSEGKKLGSLEVEKKAGVSSFIHLNDPNDLNLLPLSAINQSTQST